MAAAAEAGANVLLTHHPAFLEAPVPSRPGDAWKARGRGMGRHPQPGGAHGFHTALDVAAAAGAAGMLGLKFTLRFAEPGGLAAQGLRADLRVPDNDGEPETLARLAARCGGLRPRRG
ncbi:MAG: hypothetical protein ACLSGS_07085 [Adlercreutzia sp.]